MKNRKIKWLVCLCVSLLVLPCWTVSALWGNQEDPLDLYAQAAILMDADTGEILYEKKRLSEDGACQPDQNYDLHAGH